MKNNSPKTWYYYILFGLLYFVQGSALAYFRIFRNLTLIPWVSMLPVLDC